jgi:hypothetical protein
VAILIGFDEVNTRPPGRDQTNLLDFCTLKNRIDCIGAYGNVTN